MHFRSFKLQSVNYQYLYFSLKNALNYDEKNVSLNFSINFLKIITI
jgi:hypothetical protein